MTTDEIVDRTQQHVGNRASTTLDDGFYLDRVNEGYRDLASYSVRDQKDNITRHVQFNELNDTNERTILSTITNNFIANPSDTYSVLAIRDKTTNRPINRKPLRRLLRSDATEVGNILIWSPYGKAAVAGYLIWQLPKADTDIIEYIYKFPETLVAGTGVPVIPETWHPAIHLLAGQRAALLLGLPDLSKELAAQTSDFINKRALPSEVAGSGGPRWFGVGTSPLRVR